MSAKQRKQIIDIIKNERINNIAIVMHNSPDGDCIGSSWALQEALRFIGKKVDIILHNKITKQYAPIIGLNKVNKYILPYEGKKYDIAFVLDVADFDRTYYDIQYISDMIIIIDHHLNINIPNVNLYLNEQDSSTGITVYKIIKEIAPITKSIATFIYLTIISDTDNFSNSNTNSIAHLVTSELLSIGVDTQLINGIYNNKTLSYIKLLELVIANIKIDKLNKMIYLIISRNDIKSAGSNMREAGLIIDFMKNIENIEMAFLFIENNEQVVIKARSKSMDICKIIKKFGGGGHKCSAGCIINSDDVYKTQNKVIQTAIELSKK